MANKKSNKEIAREMTLGLPEEFQHVMVTLVEAAFNLWESLDEEDRAKFDDNPAHFMGEQIFHAVAFIVGLDEEED